MLFHKPKPSGLWPNHTEEGLRAAERVVISGMGSPSFLACHVPCRGPAFRVASWILQRCQLAHSLVIKLGRGNIAVCPEEKAGGFCFMKMSHPAPSTVLRSIILDAQVCSFGVPWLEFYTGMDLDILEQFGQNTATSIDFEVGCYRCLLLSEIDAPAIFDNFGGSVGSILGCNHHVVMLVLRGFVVLQRQFP